MLDRKGAGRQWELKVLNEEVQIAGNEVLARSGAYLPFISVAAGAGLNRYSRFTEEGAGILDDPYLPGKHFTNPSGNFLGGSTSPGSSTSTGSCGMPGTRRRSATSPPVRGGTTS